MKIKHVITAVALTTVIGFGAFGAINYGKKTNVQAAKAEYSQGSVIANDKARIWIGYDTGNPFYSYADDSTGIRLWIHSTSSGGSEKVYGTITGTFNNNAQSNRRYDYFDVDLSVYTNQWYMTVQKFQDGNWKCQTNPIQLKAANAFQVYFVWGDWAWDKTQGTVGAGAIDSVDAGLAAKALGGMHTCSSSAINGYNAFANFESTFVKDGESWKTVGNLSDYSLTDYATGDTSYSGSAATTINAFTKYQYAENMYTTGGHPTLSAATIAMSKNDTSNLVIVIVSSSALLAATAFLFYHKKKEER